MTLSSVVFLLCLATIASAKRADVYVVFGQSNSVGYNSDGHTSEDTTDPNILQTSCCSNGQANNDDCRLILGDDPLHHKCDTTYLNGASVGFGMTFARMAREHTDDETLIVLVPSGIGGTGFTDNVWTAYTGKGFVQTLARIRSTFKLLAQQYPDYPATIRAFLWHQGETDADVGTTFSNYLNLDIIPMINAWRNTTLIPQSSATTPFVVGNMLTQWWNDHAQTQRLGVMVALQLLDQYTPYTSCAPSQGLLGDQSAATPIHFTAAALRVFGRRYFSAYLSAIFNAPMK